MKRTTVLTEQHAASGAWLPHDRQGLEPMQLDGILRDPLFREEADNLKPLITLKLDDLTHLLVVNESAVASKLL